MITSDHSLLACSPPKLRISSPISWHRLEHRMISLLLDLNVAIISTYKIFNMLNGILQMHRVGSYLFLSGLSSPSSNNPFKNYFQRHQFFVISCAPLHFYFRQNSSQLVIRYRLLSNLTNSLSTSLHRHQHHLPFITLPSPPPHHHHLITTTSSPPHRHLTITTTSSPPPHHHHHLTIITSPSSPPSSPHHHHLNIITSSSPLHQM